MAEICMEHKWGFCVQKYEMNKHCSRIMSRYKQQRLQSMAHVSPFKCSLLLKELLKNIIVTYLKTEKSVSCLTFFVLFVCLVFFLSFFL